MGEEVERLRRENGELRQALAVNQEELAAALARVVELEARLNQQRDPPAFVKRNRPQAEGPRPLRKKRAAEHNTSRRRERPTRIERHGLERCPECHYRLRGESLDYSRQVVELPPPQPVEVVEHQVVKRWCPHCERWRSPPLDLKGQVMGQGRIGVGIASLVAYLRTTLRLPVRRIQEYLRTLHRCMLSVGEIVGLTHGVGRGLQPQAEALVAQVRASQVVHGDESGWREDGQNGYVWAFVTAGAEAVRYYTYDRSRSHHVVQRVLGAEFRGWLVSDFYAAYNFYPSRHQRCWVHLLRDLHELKEAQPEVAEVGAWAVAVRQLYDEAQAWLQTHATATVAERTQEYVHLFQQACVLGGRYTFAYTHPCCALAKRLLRHQDELFQFVLVPGLPADNNLAERSLRPLVVIRKISGGSRSRQGTKTRLILASLLSTWAARNLNPFLQCLAALQQPALAAPT